MVSLDTFRKMAMAFPEVTEQPHFEKTSFRVNKKIVATMDSLKKEACVKLSKIDQSVFIVFDKNIIYPVHNKWGKQGWTMIDLQKIPKAMCNDLLQTAYNNVVSKK